MRRADLAENSPVRGTMVIKPYGYAIWEAIQRELDDRFKETGHENLYFPMFIPHRCWSGRKSTSRGSRPRSRSSRRPAAKELAEPLIVRPTSETIIW